VVRGLLDLGLAIRHMPTHHWIELAQFQLLGAGAFVLRRRIEMPGSCRGYQLDLVPHTLLPIRFSYINQTANRMRGRSGLGDALLFLLLGSLPESRASQCFMETIPVDQSDACCGYLHADEPPLLLGPQTLAL